MRYPEAHAATSGSVPFALRGSKSVRRILAVAVAGAIGFAPAVMVASPAMADPGDISFVSNSDQTAEGGQLSYDLVRAGGAALTELTVTWTVSAGVDPAASDDDVPDITGEVTFPARSTVSAANQTARIVINTVDDKIDENIENLVLTVTGGNPGPIEATGKITDNDDAPGYKIWADSNEIDEDAGPVKVWAVLDGESGKDVTIPISTAAGTAKSGATQDFTPLAGNAALTIEAGALESAPTPISITDDDIYEEAKQNFFVKGAADESVSGTQTATIDIVDDEDQPEITVAQTHADEGDPLLFNIGLSGVSERPVTAQWQTADGFGKDLDALSQATHGKAKAGEDYTAASGTVTFRAVNGTDDVNPAATAQRVTVRSTQDTLDEADPEDMNVWLSAPTIAKLGEDSVGTGSIDDDGDLAPTLSLLPSTTPQLTEGNNGRQPVTFTARLNKASGKRIVVDYSTAEQTSQAQQGQDFITAKGKLVFWPGETQKTFTVDIVGDKVHEGLETFGVSLNSLGVANTAGTLDATYTIKDDDALPTVSVSPITLKEGSEGWVATLPVKLSGATASDTEFTVGTTEPTANPATAGGSGPGSKDYVLPGQQMTIPAGQTTGYVYFAVNGEDVYEPDESFTVAVEPGLLASVTPGEKTARVTVTNDDAAPSLEIVNETVWEGEDAQVHAVTNGVSQNDVDVNVMVKGGSIGGSTAATVDDFTDPGTISSAVPGGVFSGTTVEVGDPFAVTADEYKEPNETILVTGSGVGGVGSVKSGVLTIAADEGSTPGGPGEPGEAPKPTIFAPASITGAGRVSISGKVAPNATVELWGAPVSGGDLKWMANTKASTAGAYSFATSISQGTRFVTQSQKVNSNEVRVSVNQWVSLTATSPSAGRVSVVVKTSPNASGRKVVVQRWTGPNTWTNILVSKANVNGAYTATTAAPKGTIALRAWVDGDPAMGINGPGWSDIVRPVIK
uniref:Calx-beta domain-containing protein n=1 Tax=Paractinoplanes polyasparticus TaxID=2856853 RepID=UPI001C85D635|nr:Calx-beta domain-containing protein [Actinoplanes polyasparticus]